MDSLDNKKTLMPLESNEKKHKNVERILKERKLKREAEELLKEARKVSKRIEKLSQNCNHKILISMRYRSAFSLIELYECRCLFCNETLVKSKYIPEDILKKMEEASYIRIGKNDLDPKKTIRELQDMYIRIRTDYPDESEKQIAKMMKDEIKEKKLYDLE